MIALKAEPATPLAESNKLVNDAPAPPAAPKALSEFVIPPNPPKLSDSLDADIPEPMAPRTSFAPPAMLFNEAAV